MVKFNFACKLVLVYVQVYHVAFGQPPGGGATTCSSNVATFLTPDGPGKCESFVAGQTYKYPEDFELESAFAHYECPTSGVRILISNGLPNHDVTHGNPHSPCWINWFVKVPLNPTVAGSITEPAALGIKAFTLNGVPVYGPQEAGGTNAVEPLPTSQIQDAQFYWGHAAAENDHHYHSPQVGEAVMPSDTTLVGYAMDGFPIYGALADDSVLDQCNGRSVNGKYQYHVRSLDQVDENLSYCDGTSSAINWNYVLGCFSGDPIKNTVVADYTTQTIPDDCILQANSFNVEGLAGGNSSENDDDNLILIIGAAGGAAALVIIAVLVIVKLRERPTAVTVRSNV